MPHWCRIGIAMTPERCHTGVMDLHPYLERLTADLLRSATDQNQAAAEQLAAALEPSLRLTALELLSDACTQITAELRGVSIEVRLDGRDPRIVVTQDQGSRPVVTEVWDEDGSVTRTSLRLPEILKSRADQAAAEDGLSLNAWLVSTIGAALGLEARGTRSRRVGHRMTGWV